MKTVFLIPTALRLFTERKNEVEVEAEGTVRDALSALSSAYPDLKPQLYQNGELRGFINVFAGDTNIKKLAGLDTPLQTDVPLSLVPAIAGGA